MRVYYMLISLFLIFEATVQLPQNGGPTKEVSVATANSNATTLAPIKCQTVGNISGICVIRANCNYGPGVIDFTLYNPHWYKRSCKVDEACCPFKYLIVETQSSDDVVNNFDFDDDD